MTAITKTHGRRLREAIDSQDIHPFIGIYDTFSASLAAQHFDALFLSGFGFAASYYGLPDIGFIAWPDIVAWAERVRTILPEHHLMVDIDDGYCDTEVACHVVSRLEAVGASGVILEDQKRPRKCGHFSGKQLLELDQYIEKLNRVLKTRRDLFVVARTDASDPREIERRVRAFAQTDADAILVDGLRDLRVIPRLQKIVDRPFAFNQIAGGKSPRVDLDQLKDLSVSIVIYSTPCLFAAQAAIDQAMNSLKAAHGKLVPSDDKEVTVPKCTAVLQANRERRDRADGEHDVRKAA
jgi:2-methylisocitrate lyase-like PEP mutase family enzyme